MSSPHVTDAEIETFCRQELSPAMLVPLTDHLAECEICRQTLTARRGLDAADSPFDRLLEDWTEHVAETDVQAFVSGALDTRRRREIASHLELCLACRGEIRDLQQFAAQSAATRIRHLWLYGTLAAAAVLVLASAVWTVRRTQTPQPATAHNGAGGAVGVRADAIAGHFEGLTDAEAALLRRALDERRLSFPSTMPEGIGRRGALMGAAEPAAFRLVAPVGTSVLTDRPSFTWTALTGASSYTVTLQDETNHATTSGPPMSSTSWTADRPLVRGHTYLWQVVASVNGTETVAPRPPDPPARFVIVDPAAASRLMNLPPSHLARGVLFANAGLLDDAEQELLEWSAQNPRSSVADDFVKQIKALRAPKE